MKSRSYLTATLRCTLTLLFLIGCLSIGRAWAAPPDGLDWRSQAKVHLLRTPYVAPASANKKPKKKPSKKTENSLQKSAESTLSPWSLLGTATVVNTGENPTRAFQMTSQPDASQQYGVTGGNIYYTPITPFTFGQLSQLKLDWKAVTAWGGGSPRIAIAIDVDGDGEFHHWADNPPGKDGWLFVFILDGYPKFYGGPAGWQNTGNLIGNNSQSLYDSGQIRVDLDGNSIYDGTTTDNYNHALAMVGDKQVMAIQVVTDGGWFTNSYYGVFQQVVWADNITVNNDVLTANNAPVANNQAVTTDEDTAQTITLNATDADGDTLTYSIVDGTTHGALSAITGNQVTYTPATNYNGSDAFSYLVSDGNGGATTGTVHITVTPVNDAPTAGNQSVTTNEDTPQNIALTASDVDGDVLSYSIVSGPSHGALTGTGANRTYTPAVNYNGTDSFNFKANDGQVDSNVKTVSITVNAVNDVPVASNDTATCKKNKSVDISVLANDTDIEGNVLHVAGVTQPAQGSVTINAGGLTVSYTPPKGFSGTTTFSYTVTDGLGVSAAATVTVKVS